MLKIEPRVLAIIFLCFVTASNLQAYAQVTYNNGSPVPTVTAPGPQAAALGSYGGEAVDMFTGQPNIELNFYTLKTGNFTMPVFLKYNLQSVKPIHHPGLMGLGWDLITGGVVTRRVNGGVDEVKLNNFGDQFSYNDHYQRLNTVGWSSQDTLKKMLGDFSVTTRRALPSPDEFNFSVNGLSGSFYKNHEGKWIVSSSSDIDFKIESEITENYEVSERGIKNTTMTTPVGRIFYGFEITDSRGIKYIFGKTASSIDLSATPPNGQPREGFTATAWYLTKVVLPGNQVITFDYFRPEFATFEVYASFTQSANKVGVNSNRISKSIKIAHRSYYCYPKSITTPSEFLEFHTEKSSSLDFNLTKEILENSGYSSSAGYYNQAYLQSYNSAKHWYKMTGISVSTSAGIVPDIKQITNTFIDQPNTRLVLTNTKEIDETGNEKVYRFEYNDVQAMPELATNEVDHWGYYNARNFTNNVLPSNGYYSNDQLRNTYYQYREPANDENIREKGTLKKLIYPTGGSVNLYYEPHDYHAYVKGSANVATNTFEFALSEESGLAGGLRIKVLDFASPESHYLKRYEYAKNGVSSGILSGKPVYFEEGTTKSFSYYRFSSNPILRTNDTRNNYITYTTVKVVTTGSGAEEYEFSNHDNAYIDKPANGYLSTYVTNTELLNGDFLRSLRYNSMAHERGRPLRADYTDSTGRLVASTRYIYNTDGSRFDDKIRSIEYKEEIVNANTDLNVYLQRIAAYLIYSYHSFLKEKVTTQYPKGGGVPVSQTERYEYDTGNYHQLSKSSQQGSDNTWYSTYYRYPYHIRTDPGTLVSEQQPYTYMLQKHMLLPIEQISTTFVGGIEMVQGGILTEFASTGYGSVMPRAVYGLKKGLPLSGYSRATITSSGNTEQLLFSPDYKRDLLVSRYDKYGNPLEYFQKDDIPRVVLWAYNGAYPVATITGKQYQAVSEVVSQESLDNASANNGTMRSLLSSLYNSPQVKGALIQTYAYQPGVGIVATSDESGRNKTFQYDALSRLRGIFNHKNELEYRFTYHYSNSNNNPEQPGPVIFYSNMVVRVFTKNDCPSGYAGGEVQYVVKAGKYSSTQSQADADNQAATEADSNGQQYANSVGSCIQDQGLPASLYVSIPVLIGDQQKIYVGSQQFEVAGAQEYTFDVVSGQQSISFALGNPRNPGQVYVMKFRNSEGEESQATFTADDLGALLTGVRITGGINTLSIISQ